MSVGRRLSSLLLLRSGLFPHILGASSFVLPRTRSVTLPTILRLQGGDTSLREAAMSSTTMEAIQLKEMEPGTYQDHIWHFLAIAAHEANTDISTVKSSPILARYGNLSFDNGDFGWLAETNGVPLGAAWVRYWKKTDNKNDQLVDEGFGFRVDRIRRLVGIVPHQNGSFSVTGNSSM